MFLCCSVVVFVNLKLYIINVSKYVDIGIDFMKCDFIFLFVSCCCLIIGIFDNVFGFLRLIFRNCFLLVSFVY